VPATCRCLHRRAGPSARGCWRRRGKACGARGAARTQLSAGNAPLDAPVTSAHCALYCSRRRARGLSAACCALRAASARLLLQILRRQQRHHEVRQQVAQQDQRDEPAEHGVKAQGGGGGARSARWASLKSQHAPAAIDATGGLENAVAAAGLFACAPCLHAPRGRQHPALRRLQPGEQQRPHRSRCARSRRLLADAPPSLARWWCLVDAS
jgi:hypothetical protein